MSAPAGDRRLEVRDRAGDAGDRERRAEAHRLGAHEVLLLTETDPERGLSTAEAKSRLERWGPNALPQTGGSGTMTRLLRQFHHPLIYVLLVAAVVALLLDEPVDSAVIMAVVLANAVIGFVQESRAEAALDALRAMVRTRAKVVRDGVPHSVDSEDLVPGDLVHLAAGDKVPADLRLVRPAELRVDESALTGESLPVSKDESALPVETVVADRRNMVWSGTLVTGGTGTGVVVATGGETELGEIHRLVGGADTLATPLTRKLDSFSKVLTVAILALAAVTFVLGLLRGDELGLTFTAAVALAVAAIPEGLPAVVTITLAIGVARMARRRAVIRRLPCVETLGGTTVICSDKTGTLTRNEMTVRRVWTPEGVFTVEGTGYGPEGAILGPDGAPLTDAAAGGEALRWTLLTGIACNDARLTHDAEGDRWRLIGDPTEGALLAVGAKVGLDPAGVGAELPRLDTVPFSSGRRRMVTLHEHPAEGGTVTLVKGAVEGLLPICERQMGADGLPRPLDREAVERAVEELAGRGLRVLATAVRTGPAGVRSLSGGSGDAADGTEGPDGAAGEERGFVLTGLHAMMDPPRDAARDSVATCLRAGIEVKMITGDHMATARAVATDLGLPTERPGAVVTGGELAAMPPEEYRAALRGATVLARVSPEQKLRMVEALQESDEVVAMTGDGVNDAPALRQADIGVAMGRGGTEVAKEASDAVLLDDDFSTIEAAVEEGRGVFDNLSKFIVWILPTSMGQALVILAAIVMGTALPVLPTQILWVNMTTAVLLGLMLAFEPRERGIMDRPPRSPSQPLLTRALGLRVLLVGVLIVAAAMWLFAHERSLGASDEAARTAAMNVVIAIQVFYLFSCRSLRQPAWRVGFFTNPWIHVGVGLQILAQVLITYVPVMNTLFRTEPIGFDTWARILALAALASVVVAIDKRLRPGAL
ncbi:cation-transporting P-type ATPase [Streptomyces calidiresistens]|uniref:HAD-IC family P-type ATPase n=1 Tax=Streptomyces calidiresistens TaxID=1485586 RepID=A0A7W3T3H8_9ACTN|nr:HAD-IC family P-type ATPase [Streptomyces calidiresistens]MBB0230280.1 HAD-IC family P-type ATPase [Streptomyces calidiresistens]